MGSELERGPEARELAERVLITLVHALGARASALTVLGGLVPAVLAGGQDPPAPSHLGTTDVDLLLAVHLGDANESYESLEKVLSRLHFAQDEGTQGWRWIVTVDHHRVKVEFLCDVQDQASGLVIRPAGCVRLGALNLRGTRFVAEDWTEETLDGQLIDRTGTVRVQVRMAGLAGYLVAKACAILDRGWTKDYYDFAYVLIFNVRGGPGAAAEAVLKAPFAAEVLEMTRLWTEVDDRYHDSSRIGPQDYASQYLLVEPGADAARLRQDAVAAVGEFIKRLSPSQSRSEP